MLVNEVLGNRLVGLLVKSTLWGFLLFLTPLLNISVTAQNRERLEGYCEKGGEIVITDGRASTTRVQRSFISCTVSVFDVGTTNLSTIFSDYVGTPKSNPFQADVDGYYSFVANDGRYDVKFSGSGITIPFTRSGRWVRSGGGASFNLTVREQDLTPTVSNVTTIELATGGVLTDLGGGIVRINFAGGGGGGCPGTAGETNVLYVKAGACAGENAFSYFDSVNRLRISDPSGGEYLLEATQANSLDDSQILPGVFTIRKSDNGSGNAPFIDIYRGRNSVTYPTTGDTMGFISWNSWNQVSSQQSALITVIAAAPHSGSNSNAGMEISTTGNSVNLVTRRIIINADGAIGLGSSDMGMTATSTQGNATTIFLGNLTTVDSVATVQAGNIAGTSIKTMIVQSNPIQTASVFETQSSAGNVTYAIDPTGVHTFAGLTGPAVSSGGTAKVYFDNVANKLRCSENGAAYVNCVGGGGGSTAWSSLTDPSGNLSLAMGANQTTFTWAGNFAGNAFSLVGNNTTPTGALLAISSAASNNQIMFTAQPRGVEAFRITHLSNVLIARASIAAADTDGFPYIPIISLNNEPTGTPTGFSGMGPVVLESDVTNSQYRWWAYLNGAWRNLTGGGTIGGGGTTNRIPLWTSATTLGDSFLTASGVSEINTIAGGTRRINLNDNRIVIEVTNDTTTGTTSNRLVKLTGAPSTAIITGTSDTSGIVGIANANAGTSGLVQVTVQGRANCEFDGTTTAGNYVKNSTTLAGRCADAGSAYPTGMSVIGRVLTTNVGAGTYEVLLFGPEAQLNSSGSGGPAGAGNELQARENASTFRAVSGSNSSTLGEVFLAASARTGTATEYFRVLTPADTALTGDTESVGIRLGGLSGGGTTTRQFTAAGGAFAAQREIRVIRPTYSATAADTITTAATFSIQAQPAAGTNMTLTQSYAFWIEGGNALFAGNLVFGPGGVGDTAVGRASAGVLNFGTLTGSFSATYQTFPTTPSQITANQNDYNPGVAEWYRLSSDASRNITGLSISQNDGQIAYFYNIGSFDIVLTHQDAGSAAANRFLNSTGANITLTSNEIAQLRYDSTTARWRVTELVPGAGGGGAPTDATYVVMSLNGTLTNERVLTGTADKITISDGGAGGNATITIPNPALLGTITMESGSAIRTNATAGNIFTLAARDVDGAAYVDFIQLQAANTPVLEVLQPLTWSDGVKQTFNPNGTNAGINVGAHTADPSSPVNGDCFYQSTANELRCRINGAWVALGSGGGGGSPGGSDGNLQYRVNSTTFGGVAGSVADTLGAVTLAPTARTSGSPFHFKINTPADTTLAADTEAQGIILGSVATRQFTQAAGTFTEQSEIFVPRVTYSASAASDTITTASSFTISNAPAAGTNMTITNPLAFWVKAGLARVDASITSPVSGFTDVERYGANITYTPTTGGNAVLVGKDISITSNRGDALVAIGEGITVSNSNSFADQGGVLIGQGLSVTGSANWRGLVAIGKTITLGAAAIEESVVIGSTASLAQFDQTSAQGVLIGYAAALRGSNGVVIGRGAAATGPVDDTVVIGHAAGAGAADVIVIGKSATSSTANTFVAGSSSAAMTGVFFSEGITDASPLNWTLNGTGGSGTNITGGAITIAGGRGTGSATGGDIIFQSSLAGSSGTTLNALSEIGRLKVNKQLVGYGRAISVNGSAVGNVGVGLDDLQSFTLPINSLAANGDYLKVRYGGTFATNDNDKRILISFGGQTVTDSGLFDQDSGAWSYEIMYLRLTSTTVRCTLLIGWNFINANGISTVGGNGLFSGTTVTITVSDLSTNTMIMKVQAEGTANDDIVNNLGVIELTQLQ